MRIRRVASGDEGFGLVEVMVSLTVVVVTMGAVGTYLVKSVALVSRQRGEQVAAQLANSSLEQVRALKGGSLATGRGKKAVDDQFAKADAAVKPYLEQMNPAADLDPDFDPDEGADAAISTDTLSVLVDRTKYDRTVYLGECEVDMGTEEGQGGSCDKPNNSKSADDDPTSYLQYYRAVVLVTWTDRLCPQSECDYVTSTLVSRAGDAVLGKNRPSPLINKNGINPFYFYLNEPLGAQTKFKIPVYGGTLPNKWTELPKVPDGLAVNPDGTVLGTPTKLMSVTSQGKLTDATAPTGRTAPPKDLTFTVVAPPTVVAPAESKSHAGDTVNLTLVNGGTPDRMTCTATGQPTGVSLAGRTLTGSYSGPVTGPQQEFPVSFSCTDRPRSIPARTKTGTVKQTFYPVVQLAAPADQKITLGSALNCTATASGGDQTFTYSVTNPADLPTGVTINATAGVISGVPAIPGRYVPTVQVTDSIGGAKGVVSKPFAVVVETTGLVLKPVLNETDLTSTVNTAVTPRTFQSNAALLGLTTTISASGLPPGLTFNALTRTISGTPTTRGTYTVTLVATSILPVAKSNYSFLWTIT